MAEELLSLKWNNHQTHFVDILSILREHETFIDVTIACGGKLYSAHKFVLSTCSDYFKQMFMKNPSKHPIVFMKDVSSRDIEALMDFMYNGEVNVPQSTLGSLIKTAESLQIKGLAVPDDPPLKKNLIAFNNKEKRQLESNPSPPAKRLKQREVNYNVSPRNPTPKSKSPSRPIEGVNILIDEDSNSSHSAASEVSGDVKPNCKSTNESLNYLEKVSTNCLEDPLAGPSGVEKSKEKMEIKQEDIHIEEEEEEEEDSVVWNQEGDSRGEEDRGNVSMNSDNSNLFAEHLLAGNDGSSLSVSTDSAMFEERSANKCNLMEVSGSRESTIETLWISKTPRKQLELRSQLDQLEMEINLLFSERQNRNVENELYAKEHLKTVLNRKLKKLIYWQMRQRAIRERSRQLPDHID